MTRVTTTSTIYYITLVRVHITITVSTTMIACMWHINTLLIFVPNITWINNVNILWICILCICFTICTAHSINHFYDEYFVELSYYAYCCLIFKNTMPIVIVCCWPWTLPEKALWIAHLSLNNMHYATMTGRQATQLQYTWQQNQYQTRTTQNLTATRARWWRATHEGQWRGMEREKFKGGFNFGLVDLFHCKTDIP